MGTRRGPEDGTLLAGRYRLVEPMPADRSWRVYDDLRDRQLVARAVALPPGDPQPARQQVLRDAAALAQVRHPAVVHVVDAVVSDGVTWLISELPDGRTLAEVVRQGGPLPPAEAARVGLRVLDALVAAGVPHGDLTPESVLLGPDGQVMVGGFATAAGGAGAYRVPDGLAGPAADLWALGVTLHVAVEGRLPGGAAERVGALRPVLDGLLAVEPSRRIDLAEVRRRLVAAAGEAPAPVSRPPITRPVTAPPAAAPPAGRPPAGQPPVTRPPVAQPPAGRPPVNQPPAARPAAAQAARPPVGQPPAAPPRVAQPPAGRPPVTQPVARPPVSRPPVARPAAAQPPVVRPQVGRPPVAPAPVSRPPVARPQVSRPPVVEPPFAPPTDSQPPFPPPQADQRPVDEPPVDEPGRDEYVPVVVDPDLAAALAAFEAALDADLQPQPAAPPPETPAAAEAETSAAARAEDGTEPSVQGPPAPMSATPPAQPSRAADSPDAGTQAEPAGARDEPDVRPVAAETPAAAPVRIEPEHRRPEPTHVDRSLPPARQAQEPVRPAPEPVRPVQPVPQPVRQPQEPVRPAPEPVGPVRPVPQPVRPAPEPVRQAREAVRPDSEPVQHAPGPVRSAPGSVRQLREPAGSTTAGPDRPGRSWLGPVATAVAVVAVLAALLIPFLLRDTGDPDPGAAPTPATATTGAPTTTAEPTGDPTTTTASPDAADPPPAGYTLRSDPAGWSIAVPTGWTEQRVGAATRYTNGARSLTVTTRTDPPEDPYDDALRREPVIRAATPGYDLVRIARVTYRGWPTADWEYTARTTHTLSRTVVPGGQRAFTVTFTTPKSRWNADRAIFAVATRTFSPVD